MPHPTYEAYIDGAFRTAASGRTFETENPSTGEAWATVADGGAEDIDAAVAAAKRAFDDGSWAGLLPQQRAAKLRTLAELVREHGPRIAQLECRDNGKLVTEQTLQWILMVELLHHWAGWADKIGGDVIQAPVPLPVGGTPIPECFAYTRKEPVGVVGAIMPWNSPGGQLAYKFGPAMAAGCTMVAKPSEHTPVSACEFAKLVHEAGFPPGVFNVVPSSQRETGAALTEHPDVAKISFTGSTDTGRAIVRAATGNLKRVTTELGGKSAALVFADADIQKAVQGTAAGIFAAAGQTCMACSRILVQREVHDDFVAALTAYAKDMVIGDPLDPMTTLGPISNRPNYDKVLSYFEVAREEGARVSTGGEAHAELGGYFVRPTIYTDVTNDMRIAREEVFGPVAAVIAFDDEEEAIRIANASEYGLGGAVFTENINRAHRVAHRLRTGSVWINTYRLVTHMAPFGGYKASGWGREGGQEGLDAYLETKAVWVPTDPRG